MIIIIIIIIIIFIIFIIIDLQNFYFHNLKVAIIKTFILQNCLPNYYFKNIFIYIRYKFNIN